MTLKIPHFFSLKKETPLFSREIWGVHVSGAIPGSDWHPGWRGINPRYRMFISTILT